VDGVGEGLDRSQALLESQALLSENGTQPLSYALTAIPEADRSKARGEERFSVFSLASGDAPESRIASQTVQIWPVADASISGIAPDERIRGQLPQLTLTYNNLYPESHTYAQVYRGQEKLGTEGTRVPGGGPPHWSATVPLNKVIVLKGYESVFDGDGLWTMEIVTVTPFGIDRLAHVTFEIDRTLELHGTFATME
jgi:hypothetical protein